MSWTEPRRIPVCRDVAGRPVDIIDCGDGEPVVEVAGVTIPLSKLERGLANRVEGRVS